LLNAHDPKINLACVYTHPYVVGVYRGGILAFRDHIPGQLNGMNVNSIKKGESCMSSYFFAYSSGDSSIETAAIKAGITKIKQVNYFVDAIFFGLIKHEFCTIVVGE
jgi:hypothetical protein